MAPYLKAAEPGPLLRDYIRGLKIEAKTSLDFIWALNQRFSATSAISSAWSPACRRRRKRSKNGQAPAAIRRWLLVHILRHLGLAARFVSGYLIQLKADMKSLDGPSGTDHDFTDLHAWAEVYLPGAGWIGLDPTSGLFAGEGHIPLAATPSPQSAAPITRHARRSRSRVLPRDEGDAHPGIAARDAALHRGAMAGDAKRSAMRSTGDLRAGRCAPHHGRRADLRLHRRRGRRGMEHRRASVPISAAMPETLIRRLRDRFAPGGLLHYGQGKWYPGEQLPRWALLAYTGARTAAALGERCACRQRGASKARDRGRCRAVCGNACQAARPARRLRRARIRRPRRTSCS